MKKVLDKMSERALALLLGIVLFLALGLAGRLDQETFVDSARHTVMVLASQGWDEEQITSFYKFQEYPGNRIFKELKETGELDELIEKGRSRWLAWNPWLQRQPRVFSLFQNIAFFFNSWYNILRHRKI